MSILDTTSNQDLGISEVKKIGASFNIDFNKQINEPVELPEIDIGLTNNPNENEQVDNKPEPEPTNDIEDNSNSGDGIDFNLPNVDTQPVEDLTNTVIDTIIDTGDALVDSSLQVADDAYNLANDFFEPIVDDFKEGVNTGLNSDREYTPEENSFIEKVKRRSEQTGLSITDAKKYYEKLFPNVDIDSIYIEGEFIKGVNDGLVDTQQPEPATDSEIDYKPLPESDPRSPYHSTWIAANRVHDAKLEEENSIAFDTGNVIGETLNEVGDTITDIVEPVIDTTIDITDDLVDTTVVVAEELYNTVEDFFEPVVDDFIEGVNEGLSEPQEPEIEDIKQPEEDPVETENKIAEEKARIEQEAVDEAKKDEQLRIDNLPDFEDLSYDADGSIVNQAGQIVGSGLNAAGKLIDASGKIIGGVAGGIGEYIKPVIDTIEGIGSLVVDGAKTLNDLTGNIAGGAIETIDKALSGLGGLLPDGSNTFDSLGDLSSSLSIGLGDANGVNKIDLGNGLILDTSTIMQEAIDKTDLKGTDINDIASYIKNPEKALTGLGESAGADFLSKIIGTDAADGVMKAITSGDASKELTNIGLEYAGSKLADALNLDTEAIKTMFGDGVASFNVISSAYNLADMTIKGTFAIAKGITSVADSIAKSSVEGFINKTNKSKAVSKYHTELATASYKLANNMDMLRIDSVRELGYKLLDNYDEMKTVKGTWQTYSDTSYKSDSANSLRVNQNALFQAMIKTTDDVSERIALSARHQVNQEFRWKYLYGDK